MIAVLCIGVVLGLGSRWVLSVREDARRMSCGNNLKQAGMGLQNYHDIHQALPRSDGNDSAGRTPHSWRLAIEPFVMASPLYFQYDFGRAWNHPGNLRVTQGQDWLTRCPSDPTIGVDARSYLAVVGPTTAFQPGKTLRFGDFRDGLATTILLAEVHGSDISWTEPRDLPFAELNAWPRPAHRPSLVGNHPIGTVVVFADGRVTTILPGTKLPEWQALLTIAGSDNDRLTTRASAKGMSILPQETPKP
jgi:hypothetical protein